MNKIRFIIIFTAITLALAAFGCSSKGKPQSYTTTLEGIALHIPSLTGGIINHLFVDEGDWVLAGDTLAIFDTREFKYQVEQIDASLLELASQKTIAENNFDQARQDLSYVQDKQQRTQRLVSGDVLPQQNEDDINNLLQKSRTIVTNAANQLELLKSSAVKLQAQKKILIKKISDAIIISPAAGKISTLYYRQGEALAPYANLLELIDTHALEARIYLPESMLAKVKTGMQMNVITESGQKFPALVKMISNKAEFTPKTILTTDTRAAMVYAVTLKVDNPKDNLKDGMPVEVQF